MSDSGKKTKQRAPRLGKGLSSLMARPVSVDPDTVLPADKAPAEIKHDIPAQPLAELEKDVDAIQVDAAKPEITTKESTVEQGAVAGKAADGLVYLKLSEIEANPNQPRKAFNEQALQQLADSIKSAGLMQPIVVTPGSTPGSAPGSAPDTTTISEVSSYQVVAGERRWRAAKLAGLDKIPVLIRELDEQQVAEWALIENLQREDLNPIERAQAFANLIEQFEMSHEQVAKSVGIERPTVSNSLRLLALCDFVQQLIIDGHLSAGQGRALAAMEDVEQQVALANQASRQAWSVRKVEQAVRKFNQSGAATGGAKKAASARAAHLGDLEKQLGEQLQTKVKIRPGRKKGSGTLTIDFYSLDQFDDLLSRLGVSAE